MPVASQPLTTEIALAMLAMVVAVLLIGGFFVARALIRLQVEVELNRHLTARVYGRQPAPQLAPVVTTERARQGTAHR